MGVRNVQGLTVAALTAVALTAPPLAVTAAAQDRPRAAAEFAAGALFFPDDGTVTEGLLGGAARFYVSPRVSLGPEFAYVSGDRHSHTMLTGNVTFDLLAPVTGQPRRVMPFAVVGGGFFWTHEDFARGPYTSYDPAFTAGAGLRVLVGESIFVGVEARMGWELHIRLNGLVGLSF
jgi:hypothetical protein